MWAGFTRTSIRLNNIVLCVIRGLEPSLLLFLAISEQGRQRPHYYLVTLLSHCSYHRSSIAFTLPVRISPTLDNRPMATQRYFLASSVAVVTTANRLRSFSTLLNALGVAELLTMHGAVQLVGGAGFEPAAFLTFQTLAFLPSSTQPTTLPFISLSALAGHHRAPCGATSSSGSTSLSCVLCPGRLSLLHIHEAMSARISSATPS